MEARAKLLGHPIHQMLIVLPLGLLTGAVIFGRRFRLFGVSWYLRWSGMPQDPSMLAMSLSFVGGAGSLVTGWLGGELVNRLGVGVDDGANLDAPSSLSRRPPHAGVTPTRA